ncbi:MAG: hypothetical protein HWQ35_06100 [Nostoc sp. NMS1]|uniref:DUF6444 domain-containing protein n=1 Tax=unclassified Nostoc TaxID=2593658 RepID=UPI0025E628F9|nr:MULTISPECIES: DUF6444 domain-containing protein [unclassified Nostoc]MBN3906135.1 hypothetical protein [Nostoc sp. NMS1]MBN3989740.1 hypothetical protein [Nostoc sp. NMS2]
MNRLSKEDLSQMNQNYFQSLDKEKLVEVAGNLHSLAVEQLEKLEQNSSNSSLPPSSDQFKSKEKVPSLELEPTGSETSVSESKREDKHVGLYCDDSYSGSSRYKTSSYSCCFLIAF